MTDTITMPRAVIERTLKCLNTPGHQDLRLVSSALYAALAQQAEQGWVRVPVEPTQEMINAGRTTPMPSDSEFDEDEDYRAVFIAMVAAAPKGGV